LQTPLVNLAASEALSTFSPSLPKIVSSFTLVNHFPGALPKTTFQPPHPPMKGGKNNLQGRGFYKIFLAIAALLVLWIIME